MTIVETTKEAQLDPLLVANRLDRLFPWFWTLPDRVTTQQIPMYLGLTLSEIREQLLRVSFTQTTGEFIYIEEEFPHRRDGHWVNSRTLGPEEVLELESFLGTLEGYRGYVFDYVSKRGGDYVMSTPPFSEFAETLI